MHVVRLIRCGALRSELGVGSVGLSCIVLMYCIVLGGPRDLADSLGPKTDRTELTRASVISRRMRPVMNFGNETPSPKTDRD